MWCSVICQVRCCTLPSLTVDCTESTERTRMIKSGHIRQKSVRMHNVTGPIHNVATQTLMWFCFLCHVQRRRTWSCWPVKTRSKCIRSSQRSTEAALKTVNQMFGLHACHRSAQWAENAHTHTHTITWTLTMWMNSSDTHKHTTMSCWLMVSQYISQYIYLVFSCSCSTSSITAKVRSTTQEQRTHGCVLGIKNTSYGTRLKSLWHENTRNWETLMNSRSYA